MTVSRLERIKILESRTYLKREEMLELYLFYKEKSERAEKFIEIADQLIKSFQERNTSADNLIENQSKIIDISNRLNEKQTRLITIQENHINKLEKYL